MDAIQGRSARLPLNLSLAVLACLPLLMGASARTTNFTVDASSTQVAEQVARRAEECRKQIALAWLGHTLPDWPRPCPIRVKLTGGEAGGLTSFGFHRGKVTDQTMQVEGRLERILASAIPHEVTHTIFAHYLGGPMPRWADEGASLLSEDERELARHDRIVDELFERRGAFALAQLFAMEEYPRDLIGFYGQGYSISRFLIEIGGRPRFLEFIRDAQSENWDTATLRHYSLANVRELERAWLSWRKVGDAADHRAVALAQTRQPRATPSARIERAEPGATFQR